MTKLIDNKNEVIGQGWMFTNSQVSLCWYCEHMISCAGMTHSNLYGCSVPWSWHFFHFRTNDGAIHPACPIYVKIFEDIQEILDKPYESERRIVERESRRHQY